MVDGLMTLFKNTLRWNEREIPMNTTNALFIASLHDFSVSWILPKSISVPMNFTGTFYGIYFWQNDKTRFIEQKL